MSGEKPKDGSVTNPLRIPATHRVAFGYLQRALGMVHAVTPQGKPDETRLVGLYRSGQGKPADELGAAEGEAVRIDGRYRRIVAGQIVPKNQRREGERRDGIVLIDLDSTPDGDDPSA